MFISIFLAKKKTVVCFSRFFFLLLRRQSLAISHLPVTLKLKAMSIYTFIPIVFIVLYAGYWYYVKNKNSRHAEVVNNTDFKAEFANAERYKSQVLGSGLSFLQEAMGQDKIEAFNYASLEHGVVSALKDGVKDKLKGMATLGTVRFRTVQTPKYLALSGSDLHLLDTDTDGDIDNHFIFNKEHLANSRLTEIPMEGQIKAQAQARGNNVRAYKLTLSTDNKPIELIIYSCLIFTNIPEIPVDPQETIQDIVIGNDFLKQLGDKYPHLKVSLPIFS